jgi:SAM-dependent methyltransferase
VEDTAGGRIARAVGSDSPYSQSNVATTYARVAEPFQFAAPARDLVILAGVDAGHAVLDVGTGTGAVARRAARMAGERGLVVGADHSSAMLRAHGATPYPVIVASVPALPFHDDTFDCVLGGFVVSHFASYTAGLLELRRVCKPDGRVALSAWGSLPNPAAALWADTAAAFVPKEHSDKAFLAEIPWDAYFSDEAHLSRALEEAAFAAATLERREYSIEMPTTDFLAAREASVQGVLLERALAPHDWQRFRAAVADIFAREYGGRVAYVRDVHFAIARKD